MEKKDILSAILLKLRHYLSTTLLLLGCLSPYMLFILKSNLDLFAERYIGLGARLPLPMRIIYDLNLSMIWFSVAAVLIVIAGVEGYSAKKNGREKNIPGAAEMLAVIVIVLIFAIFFFEISFYLYSIDQIYIDAGPLLRHIQKFHK